MSKLNYKKEVHPIAQELCKSDENNQEMNFGQALEVINDLSLMMFRNPLIVSTLIRNGEILDKKEHRPKHNKGDIVEIVGIASGHDFNIGDKVLIKDVNKVRGRFEYTIIKEGVDYDQYVTENDIK